MLPPPRRFLHNLPSFTLIELLTVIAIIVLVAGLVVPVVGRAREKSRQVECASNLRQIGQSIAIYAADNENRVPYFTTNVLSAAGVFDRSNRSFALLSNYVNQSTALFVCPSDSRRLAKTVTNFSSFVTTTNACSYSHARNLIWHGGYTDWIISMDRVGTSTNGFELLSPTNGVAGAKWDGSNHKNAGNILLSDGRVGTHQTLPTTVRMSYRPGSLNVSTAGHILSNLPVTVQNPL